MAVVRTGPRDAESRTRDIGPAGSGVDGLSAVGRLSALRVSDVVGDVAAGYGEIERRQATPQELARLDTPEPVKATAENRDGPAMRLVTEADLFRGTSRAENRRPCACRTDVVLRAGEEIADVVARHNDTIAHLAWRAQED